MMREMRSMCRGQSSTQHVVNCALAKEGLDTCCMAVVAAVELVCHDAANPVTRRMSHWYNVSKMWLSYCHNGMNC